MRSDPLINAARGEMSASLGGVTVRLCVTLGALAQLEAHFGVRGFAALSQSFTQMGAEDVLRVLRALSLDELPAAEAVSLNEAIAAIVSAFRAMNGDD